VKQRGGQSSKPELRARLRMVPGAEGQRKTPYVKNEQFFKDLGATAVSLVC